MSDNTSSTDNVVALYNDNNWSSRVYGFEPFASSVIRGSRIMKAPVESGVLAADSKVLDPIVIKLTGKINRLYGTDYMVSNKNAIKTIAKYADLRINEFLSVRTPDGFYNNLVIENVETNGDSKEVDLVTCVITLVEMLIIQGVKNSKTKSPDNKSISRRGFVNI